MGFYASVREHKVYVSIINGYTTDNYIATGSKATKQNRLRTKFRTELSEKK